MSGSITFRHGPFQGWDVSLYSTWADGQLADAIVQIATPGRADCKPLYGVLSFAPGVDGFDVAHAAEVHGGPVRMAELLNWVVEATRAALDRRADIPAEQRTHWQAIVDEADHTRADFFARYPDGVVPPFEVVGRLSFDVRQLAGAL